MTTLAKEESSPEIDITAALASGWSTLHIALGDLSKSHSGLFKSEANERAITHVLACRWERHFSEATEGMKQPEPSWSIDCEYNRIFAGTLTKTLPYDVLLKKTALFRHLKGHTKNEELRTHLSKFEDDWFKEIEEKIEKAKREDKMPEVGGKTVVPDIILHQRTENTPDNNAFVVEAKPHWGDKKAELFDLIKLSTFTTSKDKQYPTYPRGVFLYFNKDGNIELKRSWIFKLDGGDEPEPFTS